MSGEDSYMLGNIFSLGRVMIKLKEVLLWMKIMSMMGIVNIVGKSGVL